MPPGIKILHLQSMSTGREFPGASFFGDTDMATNGWVSLTSNEGSEIVITEVNSEEYNLSVTPDGWEQALLRCEQRINSEMARTDLRSFWLLDVVDNNPNLTGLSFQEYKRRYIEPEYYYRDIFDPKGKAMVIREDSLDAFLASSGRIIYAPNDHLPDASSK